LLLVSLGAEESSVLLSCGSDTGLKSRLDAAWYPVPIDYFSEQDVISSQM
jgi:hypothetical protein